MFRWAKVCGLYLRGILCGTGLGCVNTELVAGAVGTEDGSEVHSRETLSLEKLVERIGWGMYIWKMALNTTGGGILAANQGGDSWATWAGDNSVGFALLDTIGIVAVCSLTAHEVDHVGNTNVVFLSQGNGLRGDWGETTVLGTVKLEL
jgi:hypothetical protein